MTSKMIKDIELSIVMPCLNEAETLEICIVKAKNFLQNANVPGEVVISDNGSTDGSQDIAIALGARVVHASIKGYGAALQTGIENAHGKYVIMGDADDSYDFSDLKLFVEQLRAGNGLVMGNRFKGGIKQGAMPFLHRYLGNPVLSFIGRLFFKTHIGDFHCGLRGFSREAYQKMRLRTTGMEFASEMIVKAALQKISIAEVPTTLSPDGRSRPPHLRTWRDGWRHLRFLLLFSPRWLFLYPGLLLLGLSLGLGATIYLKPVKISHLVLDIHSLIYLSFILLISFQLIFFHFFTRIYAIRAKMLPDSVKLTKLLQLLSLEKGLIIGGLILVLGAAMMVGNFVTWSQVNFGNLNPTDFVRQVLVATLTFTIGAQIIVYSFVFSFLSISYSE
ncbi:MAG: glycosyltransferase family 2 protein [Cyclobacteriaceae bacterium]|nr:glycosyltransferase family 2 protein [Cyclobacteriaceae bacterium]